MLDSTTENNKPKIYEPHIHAGSRMNGPGLSYENGTRIDRIGDCHVSESLGYQIKSPGTSDGKGGYTIGITKGNEPMVTYSVKPVVF